jgi:hypothetical protein
MAEIPSTPGNEAHVDPMAVLRDGVAAGLIGAVAVAVVHGISDVVAGVPLRTPTVLGRLVLGIAPEPSDSDLLTACWFTCIHVGAWSGLGTLGSWLISLVDVHPRLTPIAFGGFVIAFSTLLQGTGAFSIPGLPSLHLWIGTLAGSASAAGYLVRRHPKLAAHVEREHLTPTTLAEIRRALAHERSAVAALEVASVRHPVPVLRRLLDEERSRVESLLALAKGLDLPEEVGGGGPPDWARSDLAETLRGALALERRSLGLYDRFLFAVPELEVRDVLLRLRSSVADGVPSLEEALREMAPQRAR